MQLIRLPNTEVIDIDSELTGSASHGNGMNILIPKIETEYGLMVDPDVAILFDQWDEMCINELQGDVIAIGASYHRLDRHRYQDFPNLIFTLFRVEEFNKIIPVTGLVMTKLDSTAKGGILIAVAKKYKLPIIALGLGEKEDDLQIFDAEKFSNAFIETN